MHLIRLFLPALLVVSGRLLAEQIAVIPDTQAYTRAPATHPVLEQQTKWIADNAESENIVLITHVGDVISGNGRNPNFSTEEQWLFANENYQQFDGSVPFSVAYGNHDFDIFQDSSSGSTLAQSYFGADRYRDFPWFGGTSEDGENFYQFFEIGGQPLLHLAIKFDPNEETLIWAKNLIHELNLPTVLTIHAYLMDPGYSRRLRSEVEGGREPIGEFVWENLVRDTDQIFMVIGGHNHNGENVSVSGEYSEDGEYHQISINSSGREVYEILANYQDYPNGGDGWLQLINLDADANKISVRTWSPFLNMFQEDAMSQYQWDVDLRSRWQSPD